MPHEATEELPWQNITYPAALCHRPALWVWRHVFCRREWHLWDEVQSGGLGHYLSCDACDAVVGIHAVPSGM